MTLLGQIVDAEPVDEGSRTSPEADENVVPAGDGERVGETSRPAPPLGPAAPGPDLQEVDEGSGPTGNLDNWISTRNVERRPQAAAVPTRLLRVLLAIRPHERDDQPVHEGAGTTVDS